MNALASLRTALRALTKNKLRSMLAMLGIVIAVSAVVATVAIGQGAQAKVAQQMESLGSTSETAAAMPMPTCHQVPSPVTVDRVKATPASPKSM